MAGADQVRSDVNGAMKTLRADLAAARWVGRGEKESADGAAVDAMRLLLDTVPMDGLVVIGVQTPEFVFEQDAEITLMKPHMHYRGKDMRYDLVYPDGRRETILSVPNYDFEWQHEYQFKTPLELPAGTKVVS